MQATCRTSVLCAHSASRRTAKEWCTQHSEDPRRNGYHPSDVKTHYAFNLPRIR
ncbi:hypothetical protein KIN20_032938 [Parelaphostrongylus tenuis]|uniref:Uncharacterized protein n=1 Tax=Parelaphostrongylus tenuis TaxID=148309 RepID=A0AAD5R7H3_PARTN|nr:hypothetical protein KIN20_032938 [Parelaphostrongylus tenuis]